jgi:hypothetical protein
MGDFAASEFATGTFWSVLNYSSGPSGKRKKGHIQSGPTMVDLIRPAQR